MNALRTLAARRQLLVASATLQRVRLAHEWHGVRAAARPGPRALAAAVVGGAGLALALSLSSRRPAPSPGTSGLWAARALALWRLVRALRRIADPL